MIPAAANTLFAVGFTLFVVAFLVLTVLVVRFTLKRGRIARQEWLARQDGHLDEHGAEAGEGGQLSPQLTALVLAGGGTRGAAQVGMLEVLAENGFVPDRIYGASVGAINGAAFAGDPTVAGVERMADIWRGITGDDIYPSRFVHGPWQYLQQRDSIHPNIGLRKIIEAGITFDRMEDATIPFEVVATSITDGRERWLMSGPAVEAILASAAVPAIFPSVEIDGDRLVDGGVVDNVPISRAIDAGATRIFVLLCGPLTFIPPPSKRPVEVMLSALFISVHARFSRELARLPDGVEVIVFAGDGTSSRDYTDFSETEALIEAGRVEATEVLRRHGLLNPVQQPRAHPPATEAPASRLAVDPPIPPERTSEDLTTH
ncbi:MAG TPA: patatin-like phospholipase family protein [Acidimicrobiales bacterium]|jgi:NTE family protein|nr:patatin-like phospholipase family protein [Acidimicrobiales bacterium]